MKAGIFFTGSGPILVLTSYSSLTDPDFVKKMTAKGIKKFIAFEISVDLARQKYGHHYNAVMNDLRQEDDCRVVDFDGHHVLYEFSFKEFGSPIFHEQE